MENDFLTQDAEFETEDEIFAETEDDMFFEDGGKEKSEEEEKEVLYEVQTESEKRSFTIDELKENAKKGMEYEKIKESYDKLKKSPVMEMINSMAQKSNMSAYEFVLNLQQRENEEKAAELMDRGVPEKEARRLIELEQNQTRILEKQKQSEPFDEFIRQYPDVRGEDIDKSVWEEFSRTGDLAGAYARFENRQLKTKIEMMERNGQNKKKSIGETAGTATAVYDAFLQGLMD